MSRPKYIIIFLVNQFFTFSIQTISTIHYEKNYLNQPIEISERTWRTDIDQVSQIDLHTSTFNSKSWEPIHEWCTGSIHTREDGQLSIGAASGPCRIGAKVHNSTEKICLFRFEKKTRGNKSECDVSGSEVGSVWSMVKYWIWRNLVGYFFRWIDIHLVRYWVVCLIVWSNLIDVNIMKTWMGLMADLFSCGGSASLKIFCSKKTLQIARINFNRKSCKYVRTLLNAFLRICGIRMWYFQKNISKLLLRWVHFLSLH